MQSQYPKIDIVIQIQASCCLAVAPVDDQGMMHAWLTFTLTFTFTVLTLR